MRTVAVVLLGALSASGVISSASFDARIDSSIPAHYVEEAFVGFTTDYWLNVGPYGDEWNPNGGILTANLSDPRLINLVSALAPATWRIGGTPADSVVYVVGDE